MSPTKKKLKHKAKQSATKDNIVDKETEKKKLIEEVNALKKELRVLREDKKNLEELTTIEKQNVKEQVEPKVSEHKMFEFYGIVCETKDDESSKFIFPMLNEDGSRTEYFIHISNNDEQRELMKFFLPTSINLDEILAENPINNAKKFPDLLLQLRHNILCYQNRKKQLTELKKHLVTLKNCEVVYRNDGITKILIRFYSIEHETMKKTFNFDIIVNYLSEERLPHQFSVTPSSVTDDDFDDQTLKLLKKKFVKLFKKAELKQAIENLVQADTRPFIWTSTTKPLDENFDPSLSEDEDSINEFFTSLKNKTISKSMKKENKKKKKKSEAGTTTDGNVKMKKNKKGMKKKRTETLDSRNEDEQQTELTMESPAKRNETSTKSLDVIVTDRKESSNKTQGRKKTRQAEVQENQSEDENPSENKVKIPVPVKKKEVANQSLNKSATDEKETTKKSGKIKKTKQVETVESQSENEQPVETTAKSPVKKKKTANSSLHKTALSEKEIIKKSGKIKEAKQTEVVESQSTNEQPVETPVKRSGKQKRTANQSLNKSLTKKMKIDPKQTTLNFDNKVDDAKKSSKIPVMKKKLPTIVNMQKFSSSTPLLSKQALRTEKERFCDISNISEIGKE